jgi:lipopolysaccharide export system permease protein
MKLIDRHIIQEIAPGFLATVILFAGFILIAGGPLLTVVKYLSEGVPLWLVAEITGLFLPPMLVLAFPMGMLISVILGFTRLSSESEVVAIFASGISFYRMLIPTALFGAAVALGGLIINDSVVPAANARISQLRSGLGDVPEVTEPFALPPIRSGGRLQALVWVEGGYEASDKTMRQVTLVEYDAKGEPQATIYAQSAQWSGGNNWIGKNVRMIEATSSVAVVAEYASLSLRDIKQTPNSVAFEESDPDNLTFAQLDRLIQEQKRLRVPEDNNFRDAEVSLWNKISLPLASLVFALVGAAVALRTQRGASRQAAFGYGILIILGYYAVEKYLVILGDGGQIDPALAAFLPNLIGMALAGYLISQATT